ncbi:hypothetical protein JKI95_08255 [Corynebacterium aquatimens]|uniref:hypothetical protein n=1 Tax=Corynebacterium aquatimens TaxID=1190508 RepID=UPI002542077D|nr:hypothetical protein [Corynebacterium aquatimens]QYH19202.1 hypothetical protein JKI95_08255 [Corynebacterium aquatimens]
MQLYPQLLLEDAMKKTLRAGALAVALATTSVTVPAAIAPAALAAEQPAGNTGAAKQSTPKTLDEQIADAEAQLEQVKTIYDTAKLNVEALKAAIANDGKPTAAQQKALDDAKAAFAPHEAAYKAAKKKRDDAKAAVTAAQTKANDAAKALKSANDAVTTAQAELNQLNAKVNDKDTPKEKQPTAADIAAAEEKLAKAKEAVPGKEKAVENANWALQTAQGTDLLVSVEFDDVEKKYNEADLALKKSRTRSRETRLAPRTRRPPCPQRSSCSPGRRLL